MAVFEAKFIALDAKEFYQGIDEGFQKDPEFTKKQLCESETEHSLKKGSSPFMLYFNFRGA